MAVTAVSAARSMGPPLVQLPHAEHLWRVTGMLVDTSVMPPVVLTLV